MSVGRAGLVLVLAPGLAGALAAQDRRCQMEIVHVGRQGVYTNVIGTSTTNYFAGGNVEYKCRGQEVRIWSDSVASYQGQVVQFIGNFRYQDETARVTSDFGTYYKDNERWEARGHVLYRNTRDGSELKGPSADYLRKIKGTRELEEVYADQRPTLTLAARDSLNQPSEPYLVVGDRIRLRGEDLMWAGGTVTIDRSDLKGRADSMQLDTGKGNAGALIGHASIRRAASDSFALSSRRIDLALEKKELTGVTGRDSAALTSKNLDLTAATIFLRFEHRKVAETRAWGKAPRPRALADEYEVRGDSLAIDTPAEQLRELRAFTGAWVGFKPDSAQGQRDYLTGESIVASFEEAVVSGAKKAVLRRLDARQSATSFYRMARSGPAGTRPSINYSRADRIVLTLQGTDSLKVEKVEMTGKVDGMQLEPQAARPDTLRPKPDTAAVRRPEPS